jgi:hypothetical protein
MTFFRSYFDESGKFNDHRVVSFCGVVASPESLKSFTDAWDALLRNALMTHLHTTNALRISRALSPKIPKQSPSERCEALAPFVDCILDNLDVGIVVSIDVEAYLKWPAKAKKRLGGSDNPTYASFAQAIGALKMHACRDDDRLSMMCDDDEETVLNFYKLYRRFKKIDPELKKKLVSLSFSDDNAFPGLQAADLIAGLIRLESLLRFGYHTHDFKPLVSRLMVPRQNQKLKWLGFLGDSETLSDIGVQLQNIKGLPKR